MNLTTQYLGLTLRSPLVPSASPLSDEISGIRRMEDAGAAAVVLHSLFEEQLLAERQQLQHFMLYGTESYPEAITFFPEMTDFSLGPHSYLEHIRRAKEAVDIPIIASLNGTTLGGWTDFAKQIQQAGADALELNVYFIATDMAGSGAEVEELYFDILRAVKMAVSIPVAMKLSPFFSNMANMAQRLDGAGADGLVLFNRFYQPDIDLETLEIVPRVLTSTPHDLRLPLTWIGILHGRVEADLAATSGVHTAHDVLKLLMAGADVTQLCSVLFNKGIEEIANIERGLREWMDAHEYDSVAQMRGSMSQLHCPDPGAFERAQYMRALKTFRVPEK